jgi:hypothetical protein
LLLLLLLLLLPLQLLLADNAWVRNFTLQRGRRPHRLRWQRDYAVYILIVLFMCAVVGY